MFGNNFNFLSSKIWRISLNEQSNRQPLSGPPSSKQPSSNQFDQNPWNKLSHTSFGTYHIFFSKYWFPSFIMIVNDGPKLWHMAQ